MWIGTVTGSRFSYLSHHLRPGWLSRVIDWTVHAVTTAEFYRDANKQRNTRGTSSLARSYLDDVALMFQKMRIVYATLDNDNEEEFELQVSCLHNTSFCTTSLGVW